MIEEGFVFLTAQGPKLSQASWKNAVNPLGIANLSQAPHLFLFFLVLRLRGRSTDLDGQIGPPAAIPIASHLCTLETGKSLHLLGSCFLPIKGGLLWPFCHFVFVRLELLHTMQQEHLALSLAHVQLHSWHLANTDSFPPPATREPLFSPHLQSMSSCYSSKHQGARWIRSPPP